MSDLKISQSAFDAAGQALDSAAGLLDGLSAEPFPDLGHRAMKRAAFSASIAWTTGRSSLAKALQSESKQIASAATVFEQIDQALAGNLTGNSGAVPNNAVPNN